MELKLYKRDTCPYCQLVMRVIKELDAPVTLCDITTDPANLEELLKVGGKQQVPCLFIDGKPLYESADIINWLRQNFSPQD